jgi:hypothetical protein
MNKVHAVTPLISIKKLNKAVARAEEDSPHKQSQQHASPKKAEQPLEQAVQHIDERV